MMPTASLTWHLVWMSSSGSWSKFIWCSTPQPQLLRRRALGLLLHSHQQWEHKAQLLQLLVALQPRAVLKGQEHHQVGLYGLTVLHHNGEMFLSAVCLMHRNRSTR